MAAFGDIVLAHFPFTDLSGDKRGPALVVSNVSNEGTDLIVAFISSVPRVGRGTAAIRASSSTGLKQDSIVRFDKLATLERSVVAGLLGRAPADWLAASRSIFHSAFGFSPA